MVNTKLGYQPRGQAGIWNLEKTPTGSGSPTHELSIDSGSSWYISTFTLLNNLRGQAMPTPRLRQVNLRNWIIEYGVKRDIGEWVNGSMSRWGRAPVKVFHTHGVYAEK